MAISDRGFAHMDKAKQREIASKGGKASGRMAANRKSSSTSTSTASKRSGGSHRT